MLDIKILLDILGKFFFVTAEGPPDKIIPDTP